MAQINISGNNFYDDSRMVGEFNEYNFNWNELEREADALKNKTVGNTMLSPAMTELQAAIKSKNKGSVIRAIRQYTTAFSSAMFANLASAGILELINNFLH